MHRSNWGQKSGQERVLAVRVTRVGWEKALSLAVLTSFEPGVFASPDSPLREDVPNHRRLDPATATAAAPESEDGFFLVPPIVENLAP